MDQDNSEEKDRLGFMKETLPVIIAGVFVFGAFVYFIGLVLTWRSYEAPMIIPREEMMPMPVPYNVAYSGGNVGYVPPYRV